MARLAPFPETIGDSIESLKEQNDALRQEMRALEIRLGELERLADSDTLTPLLNRRAFLREVSRCIARFERHGTPVIVMIADLDGLKAINDSAGHQAGDAVLMHVGYTLKTQLRTIDTVARIGGDEFGMILEELDLDAAEAKARSLAASVSEDTVDGQAVSISIGYTLVEASDTLDRIMARADEAMYIRKRAQRSLK